jgi:hypothetical protein
MDFSAAWYIIEIKETATSQDILKSNPDKFPVLECGG